jgi:hypothetical protein
LTVLLDNCSALIVSRVLVPPLQVCWTMQGPASLRIEGSPWSAVRPDIREPTPRGQKRQQGTLYSPRDRALPTAVAVCMGSELRAAQPCSPADLQPGSRFAGQSAAATAPRSEPTEPDGSSVTLPIAASAARPLRVVLHTLPLQQASPVTRTSHIFCEAVSRGAGHASGHAQPM